MFLALALAATIHVAPGDTLSGIAASHGVSLSALEAANPQFTNPNLIFAGQGVNLPGQSSISGDSISGDHQSSSPASSLAPVYHSSSQSAGSGTSSGSSSSGSSGSLSSIPGVPSSFAACVALHESGNGSASSNVYGIIPASGYNGFAMSLAQQKNAFSKLYAQYGTAPWAPYDGC